LVIIGLVLTVYDEREKEDSARKITSIFNIIYLGIICYTSGIMARLTALTTPVMSVIGAYGALELIKSNVFYRLIIYISLIIYATHGIITTSQFLRHPVIYRDVVMNDGAKLRIDDYRESYKWLRDNLSSDVVVGMWWDYGYPLSYFSNLTTVVDNNTWNSDHISKLALGLVSPIPESNAIFQKMNIDVICVVQGGHVKINDDDIGKLYWMGKIATEHFKDWFKNEHLTNIASPKDFLRMAKHQNTTLFNLVYHLYHPYDYVREQRFPLINRNKIDGYYKILYSSSNGVVLCYRVENDYYRSNRWNLLKWDGIRQPSVALSWEQAHF